MRTDKGAVRFIAKGANLMCRGLTTPGAHMDMSVQKGDMVTITAEGEEFAIGVGNAILSAEEIKSINDGIGIEMVHYRGDALWKMDKIK
jgi:PUA domain protein